MDKTTGKIQLSHSILEMKFMKRTKEKVRQQEYQIQGEEYFENELTAKMKKDTGSYIMEQSYAIIEQLIDGRVSFHGMNPEIEKIMELDMNMKRAKEDKPKETDVSDEQMAKRWRGSHIETMRKRFKTKKRRNSAFNFKAEDALETKKLKFCKPSD